MRSLYIYAVLAAAAVGAAIHTSKQALKTWHCEGHTDVECAALWANDVRVFSATGATLALLVILASVVALTGNIRHGLWFYSCAAGMTGLAAAVVGLTACHILMLTPSEAMLLAWAIGLEAAVVAEWSLRRDLARKAAP